MKRYKLLKDTVISHCIIKAGSVFIQDPFGYRNNCPYLLANNKTGKDIVFDRDVVENHRDWFKEINNPVRFKGVEPCPRIGRNYYYLSVGPYGVHVSKEKYTGDYNDRCYARQNLIFNNDEDALDVADKIRNILRGDA